MDSVPMVPDVPAWVYPVFGFTGFLLCMIPLPWHLQAWNTGTCLYMIWTGIACLNQFINSIVWRSDAIDRAPVWCDISSQIIIASSVAIPASSLCIQRRLWKIASVQSVTTTRAQKRRDIMADLAIGLGIPICAMALHVIVQSQRYFVFEQVGCAPFTFNTPLAYVLFFSWPLAISLVSATYCIMTIRELAMRRAQFKEFLATNRNLSAGRYFRLMGLAGVEILFTIPVSSIIIYLDATTAPVEPYTSWAYAHDGLSTSILVPAAQWRSTVLSTASVEIGRWLFVLCAVVFFAFFGFADEARKNYRLAYVSVAKRVGLSTGSISATGTWSVNGTDPNASHNSGSASMPVYITHETEKKRDSFASYSSRLSIADYGGALADVKQMPFSPTTTSSGSISRESLPKSPVDLPPLPEVTLDINAPPRYTPDAPNSV